jgi:pyroglutamyl-peptidase
VRLRPVLACLAGLSALTAACTDQPSIPEAEDPNDGLLRDFLDGKFDDAGHPLNAKIVEADAIASCGAERDGAVELAATCDVVMPMGAELGGLTVNARVRVRSYTSAGAIVKVTAKDLSGAALGSETLTVSRLRARNRWVDVPVRIQQAARVARVTLDVSPGAVVDLQYVEVFPKDLGVVIAPGSGVYRDSDVVTIELPRGKKIERFEANGIDLRDRLDTADPRLVTKTTTAFRTLISFKVGDLMPDRADVVDLRVHSSGDTSRAQIRRTPAACNFEGDPDGAKVLVTGFQPFPADGWHENVSAVAVGAARPSALHGVALMKVILPVEYDRAAALVTEVIARCQPAHVISFGQGGGSIALEHTAYNLQDTGELSGGAPDNPGIIRAAQQISVDAPATRATLLPLDAIEAALVDLGESPQPSTDPGRYICNNVMFADIGAIGPRGGKAGFIHLPYPTQFDDETRSRFGQVVEAAVQATVDTP